MKKISILLLLLFIFFSSTNVIYAGELDFTEKNKPSYEEQKRKNIKFRKEFGLSTDEMHIEKLLQAGEEGKVHAYGIELSKSEHSELKARFEHLNNVMPKIMEHIEKNFSEEAFGGIYVEQLENGKLYVNYLEGNELSVQKDFNEIKNLFGSENVAFKKVKHSKKDLDETNKKIFDDREALLNTYKIEVLSIKTNLKDNNLVVGVYQLDKEKEKVLTTLYGNKLVFENAQKVEEREVSSGLRIVNQKSDGSCSSGFSAYKSSTYYIVTAGHCSSGYAEEGWTSGGTKFGTMYYPNFYESGNSDVGLITTTSNHTSAYIDGYGFATNYSYGSGYVGQNICISGQYSDNCGKITSTYYSSGTSGLYDLNSASYDAIPGDSGGTIRDGSTIYGIHYGDVSGSGTDEQKDEAYSKLGNILNRLGILPIVR